MALFTYTARLRIASGHVAGREYGIEVDLQEAIRSRRVRKVPIRAVDGTTETLYRGGDTLWQIIFAPVSGRELELLEELLASAATGQPFKGWLFGSEVEPLTLTRDDTSARREAFMRTGIAARDHYVHTMTAREA